MAAAERFTAQRPCPCAEPSRRPEHCITTGSGSRPWQRRRRRANAAVHSLWQSGDFPRIIEDIPRRLPHPDFPSVAQGIGVQLKDLFVPTTFSGQEVLAWGSFLFACVLLGTLSELIAAANRTADRLAAKRELDEAEGEDDGDAFGLGLGPSMPDVPKTRAAMRKLRRSRRLYAAEIRAERARGLKWLALITAVTVWCTGILTRDNALSP